MAYLTLNEYKARSLLPSSFVDEVELLTSGWTLTQLDLISALMIDGPLAKRYKTPFEAPYSLAVLSWLTRLMDPRVLLRRGVDSSDAQWVVIFEDAQAAKAEILEAANAQEGLYDLPLRADSTASGVVRGFPKVYSSSSPYVTTSKRASRARDEDGAGDGTTIP